MIPPGSGPHGDADHDERPRPRRSTVPAADRARAIARVAATQDGIVARRQLLDLGIPARAIDRRVASGALWRVLPGVYAVGHPALDWRGRARAAMLLCGTGSALVGPSAATLAGLLPERPDAPVHVAPGRGRPRSRPGLVVHRTTLRPEETAVVAGLPVTRPPRTLIDLASSLDDRALRRVVNEAQIRTRTTPRDILDAIDRAPGRRTNRLRKIVVDATGPRRSGLEDALWTALGAAGLTAGARANARIGRWEVDVVWLDDLVAAEVDGFRYHRTRDDRRRDERKAQDIRAGGFDLLRLSDDEVEHEMPRVIASVATALAKARAARRP